MRPRERAPENGGASSLSELQGRPFEIWDGTGNDFVFFPVEDPTEMLLFDGDLARRVCADVGVDGLFLYLLESTEDLPVQAQIWNSDGSEAAMCGNALRCLAALLYSHLGRRESRVKLGSRTVRLWGHNEEFAAVALGAPEPLPGSELLEAFSDLDSILGARGHLLGFGNPHYVALYPDIPEDWVERGREAQSAAHRLFGSGGINAGFLASRSQDGVFHLRVYERGAGPTQACGSGACAASAVLEHSGVLPPHRFKLPGGVLEVDRWNRSFRLSGPVRRKGIGEWRWI